MSFALNGGSWPIAAQGVCQTCLQLVKPDAAPAAPATSVESEVGRLLFEKKLNDREAAAAFKVGEIYGRYERCMRAGGPPCRRATRSAAVAPRNSPTSG